MTSIRAKKILETIGDKIGNAHFLIIEFNKKRSNVFTEVEIQVIKDIREKLYVLSDKEDERKVK